MTTEGSTRVAPKTKPVRAKGINSVPPTITPLLLATLRTGLFGCKLYLQPKKLYLE